MGDVFTDYQCLESGTQGEPAKPNRSIPDRIKDYCLINFIDNDSDVLDIGCNRGFFGIELSPYINSYMGIEQDKKQLQFGIDEASKRNINNCLFINSEFTGLKYKFDLILSLAVHSYIKMTMVDYAENLISILNPGGYICLEGHPKDYRGEPEKYFNPLVNRLSDSLKLINYKIVTDRTNKRPFIVFRRNS